MFFYRMLILISLSEPQQPNALSNPAATAVKEIKFCSPAFIQVSAPLWPQGLFLPQPLPSSHFKATCEYMYMTEMDLCALPAAFAE